MFPPGWTERGVTDCPNVMLGLPVLLPACVPSLMSVGREVGQWVSNSTVLKLRINYHCQVNVKLVLDLQIKESQL